ncbi:hypothetical protein [Paenibacillus chibensis]|uniref:hypothetical protein n=1 Tax=Paenibacillus chibensis TaxID=59846 RepID=UPI000FDAEEC1|nr:hypothetical protein [Paenibacillus chibensis]MEC0373325.1 hypothetical protein [Paenibacillus chibensis]
MIGKERPKFEFGIFMCKVGLVAIGILLVPLFNDHALNSIISFTSQFTDYNPAEHMPKMPSADELFHD